MMTDKSTPFEELDSLIERMNRQFGELSRTFDPEPLGVLADVPVDVVDDGESIVVIADLPGVERDEIDLRVDRETLTISATPADTERFDDDQYHRNERQQASVRRRLTLPVAVDASHAIATASNGVLTVTLPKQDAAASGYQIDVE